MRLLPVLLVLAGLFPPGPSCAKAAKAGIPAPDSSGPAPSMEALVLRSIAALNARDTLGLARLSIGREEFLMAYPHFAPDTSRARRDFVAGYFLEDNRKLMRRVLEQDGGRDLALVRFTVQGPVEPLGGTMLHRGVRVWVRRDSAEVEIGFIRSMARTGSSWKIWGFSDN